MCRGLADEYWSYYRGTEQLWNIDRGDVEQIEHWEDLSASGVADRIARLTDFAQQADELHTKGLDDQQLTLLGALTFSARATAAGLPYTRDLALVAGSFPLRRRSLSVLVPGYTLVTRATRRRVTSTSCGRCPDSSTAGFRVCARPRRGRVATARGVSTAVAAYDALPGHRPRRRSL